MKKILTKKSTLIVSLLVLIIVLGSVILLATRPISYNMEYNGAREDEYGYFEITKTFRKDEVCITKNTNFDLPFTSFYYYKDGYLFDLNAKTYELVEFEKDLINNNWDTVLSQDFYASKINAFRMIMIRPDGAETILYCKPIITLTIIGSAISLVFIALSASCIVAMKKKK